MSPKFISTSSWRFEPEKKYTIAEAIRDEYFKPVNDGEFEVLKEQVENCVIFCSALIELLHQNGTLTEEDIKGMLPWHTKVE